MGRWRRRSWSTASLSRGTATRFGGQDGNGSEVHDGGDEAEEEGPADQAGGREIARGLQVYCEAEKEQPLGSRRYRQESAAAKRWMTNMRKRSGAGA